MAALTEQQRGEVWRRLVRIKDALWGTCAATKPELRQLVDALDDWLESNAATVNLAIPLEIRAKFTAAQKAIVFAYVAIRRFGG